MDLSRISTVMDVPRLDEVTVSVVGAGGSSDLVCNLARCGIRKFKLIDFDVVDSSNIARQGHTLQGIGMPKVDALATMLKQINPAVEVTTIKADFTAMSDEVLDAQLANVDLIIFATDSFAAQARGNEVALRLNISAMWIGLYPGGVAGEIIFWHPELDTCYRCMVPARYEAQAKARARGQSLDPLSQGATIFDITQVDAIAGQIAIGLLTRGSPDRHGQLIDQLGDRNFLQIKNDPNWTFNGRDVVREQLGISADNDAYFSWNTIARRDPDRGQLPCPDCERFRGHVFVTDRQGHSVRIKPGQAPVDDHSPAIDQHSSIV